MGLEPEWARKLYHSIYALLTSRYTCDIFRYMSKDTVNDKLRDTLSDEDISAAEEFAAKVLSGNYGGHDISHVLRVENNACVIMDGEKSRDCDKRLVLLCCALHDVDDRKFKKECAERNSELRKFFNETELSERIFERASDIISCVSFTDNKAKNPDLSIEAQIVQDADRLDAIGAVGIARAFAYGGSVGRNMYGDGDGTTIAHFYDKLLLLSELMNTETAKRIANERTEYMMNFLAEFDAEIGGKAYTNKRRDDE